MKLLFIFWFFQLHSCTQNRGDQENIKPNLETFLHLCEITVQRRLWQVNHLIPVCFSVCPFLGARACQDSSVGRGPDLWLRGHEFNSWQQRQGEIFLLQNLVSVLILIQWTLHPQVIIVVHKRPWSFSKHAGGRLHLKMHTLLTPWRQSGLTMFSGLNIGIREN